MEFSSSVASLIHPDDGGPPLQMTVEGTVFGEEVQIHIVWKPKFDLVRFVKELFTELWERVKGLAREVGL